jgi:ketosteroid isomerase-like protein
MKNNFNRAFIIIPLFLLMGCSEKVDIQKETASLLQADREFSNASIENGMKKAFLDYISDDCVLLRAEQRPIEGRAAIETSFSQYSDERSMLSWTPLKAIISKSGDLGYTYGIWESKRKDTTGLVFKGTYLTIWKKNAEGKWEAILDTGNPGID